jgi:BNR/Asp-box repeat
MDLLVGTTSGIFNPSSAAPAGCLSALTVRQLIQVDCNLFAAASDGVYRSVDAGRSWTRAGVDSLEVWNIAASPHEPRTLYASTQPAHLFVSHDGGDSWHELASFLDAPGANRWCVPGNPPQGARALALAFDPSDPQRLWVGVEVGGVVISEDDGASWSVSVPCGNADVHLLAVHPSSAGVLFATTGYGRNDDAPMDPRLAGPYRSDDYGRTWRYLGKEMQPHYTRAMCVDPRPPHVLTIPAAPDVRSSVKDPDGAQSVVFRSEDEGASWHPLGDAAHSPARVRLTAVAPDPEQAGSVLVGTETGEVWRVTSNATWSQLCQAGAAVQSILPLRP